MLLNAVFYRAEAFLPYAGPADKQKTKCTVCDIRATSCVW